MGIAQQLRVQVQEKGGQDIVPFAYIHVVSDENDDPSENTVQADENGIAVITITSYPATLKVSALGYNDITQVVKEPSATITVILPKNISTLNEVVVTGLIRPVRQKDALSTYKVIPRDQIQAQGAVTLDEVLKNQLNMSVTNDNILGSAMRMQGMGGNKVKILIDGIPVNGREGGNINLSQMNMNNVGRVEIVQGPMSVVYGTDALGGVINIITKKSEKDFELNAGTYYESIGKYNADFMLTKNIKERHQLSLGGGRNYFNGWGPISQYYSYLGDTMSYSRSMLFKPNQQYLGNLSYIYSAPSGFTINLGSDYLNEKISNKGNLEFWHPSGSFAFDEYYRTTRSHNRLSFTGKLGSGTWQLQNGYSHYYRTRTSYRKDMVNMSEELRTDPGAQDTSTFADVYLRGAYANTVNKLEYTVGYDVNLQNASSLKLAGKVKDIQDYALYTNLNYELVKDILKVQGGVRAAVNSLYSPPVMPSLNLLYTPRKNLQVRASYAKGYRAPSLKEMYLSFIDFNHYVIGNEQLLPETGEHYQVSASLQTFEKDDDYLQLTLSGFYNNVYNGITLSPMDPANPNSIKYSYANLAHQVNTIATIQADGQLKDLHYQLGYSYLYTFADPGNYNAFGASEINGILQYTWRKAGVSFNLFNKYISAQPFLQAFIDGSAGYNGQQKGFYIGDFSVQKKLLNNDIHITAGVKNILDVQQPTVTGRVSSGAHGDGISSFLPRSIFTTIRVVLD